MPDYRCYLFNSSNWIDRVVDFLEHGWGLRFDIPLNRFAVITGHDQPKLRVRVGVFTVPVSVTSVCCAKTNGE
jgi:hypothetical protein